MGNKPKEDNKLMSPAKVYDLIENEMRGSINVLRVLRLFLDTNPEVLKPEDGFFCDRNDAIGCGLYKIVNDVISAYDHCLASLGE